MITEQFMQRLPEGHRDVVSQLATMFAAAGEELFLVGGIVRDATLGLPLLTDLDFATSAPPPRTRELVESAAATSVYLVGERFGTVGAIFDREGVSFNVEITTYRREAYPDETRFPAVEFGASLLEDLSRRDLTINAMAINAASGDLVDPWHGQADVEQAVIRAVGDPDERFVEDPLRMLRAARFVAQLGFRLDWQTEQAMCRRAPSIERISRERVQAEMSRLLLGDYAGHGLDVLRRTDVLRHALPELIPLLEEADDDLTTRRGREKDLWDHTLRVVDQSPHRLAVRWAALLHDAAKPLTRTVALDGEIHFFGHERVGADLASRLLTRLNADKALRTAVRTVVELHGRPAAYDESWTDSAVRRLALEAGDAWDDLLDLAAADVTSGRERKRVEAARRVTALRTHFARLQQEADLAKLESPLDGHDLMQMFSLPPGPWIKHVKDRLRELVIDGQLAPGDRERAAAIAHEIVAETVAST